MPLSRARFARFYFARYTLIVLAVPCTYQATATKLAPRGVSSSPPELCYTPWLPATCLQVFLLSAYLFAWLTDAVRGARSPLVAHGRPPSGGEDGLRVGLAAMITLVALRITKADPLAIGRPEFINVGGMADDMVTNWQAYCKRVLHLSTPKNLGLKEVIAALEKTA